MIHRYTVNDLRHLKLTIGLFTMFRNEHVRPGPFRQHNVQLIHNYFFLDEWFTYRQPNSEWHLCN